MEGKIHFKVKRSYQLCRESMYFDYGIVYFKANKNIRRVDFNTFLKGQVVYKLKDFLPISSLNFFSLISDIEIVDLYLEK